MIEYVRKIGIMVKTVTACLVLTLFFEPLSFACVEKGLLSPELAFSEPVKNAELKAAMVCELIEKRIGKEKKINDVYFDDILYLGNADGPGRQYKIETFPGEKRIYLSGSNIMIRYFDPGKRDIAVDGVDIKKVKSVHVNEHIVRQVLENINLLPVESDIGGILKELRPISDHIEGGKISLAEMEAIREKLYKISERSTPEENDRSLRTLIRILLNRLSDKAVEEDPALKRLLLAIISRLSLRCTAGFIHNNIPAPLIVRVFSESYLSPLKDKDAGGIPAITEEEEDAIMLIGEKSRGMDKYDTLARIVSPVMDTVKGLGTDDRDWAAVGHLFQEITDNGRSDENDHLMKEAVSYMVAVFEKGDLSDGECRTLLGSIVRASSKCSDKFILENISLKFLSEALDRRVGTGNGFTAEQAEALYLNYIPSYINLISSIKDETVLRDFRLILAKVVDNSDIGAVKAALVDRVLGYGKDFIFSFGCERLCFVAECLEKEKQAQLMETPARVILQWLDDGDELFYPLIVLNLARLTEYCGDDFLRNNVPFAKVLGILNKSVMREKIKGDPLSVPMWIENPENIQRIYARFLLRISRLSPDGVPEKERVWPDLDHEKELELQPEGIFNRISLLAREIGPADLDADVGRIFDYMQEKAGKIGGDWAVPYGTANAYEDILESIYGMAINCPQLSARISPEVLVHALKYIKSDELTVKIVSLLEEISSGMTADDVKNRIVLPLKAHLDNTDAQSVIKLAYLVIRLSAVFDNKSRGPEVNGYFTDEVLEPLAKKIYGTSDSLYSENKITLSKEFGSILNHCSDDANKKIVSNMVIYLRECSDSGGWVLTPSLYNIIHTSEYWKNIVDEVENGAFDARKQEHLYVNYLMVKKKLEGTMLRLSYDEYLDIVNGEGRFPEARPILKEDLRLQLKGLVYEAYLVRKKILEFAQRAEEIGREIVVVENMTYGGVALAPVTEDRGDSKYVVGTDIRVISTKVGSSSYIENKAYVYPKVFNERDMKYFAEKRPVVVVVDGTALRMDGTRQVHIPLAYRGYRNYFMAVNRGLNGRVEPSDFYTDDKFYRSLTEDPLFAGLAAKFSGLSGGTVNDPYKMFLWYPGRYISDVIYTPGKVMPIIRDLDKIKGASLIFVESSIEKTAIDDNGREYINGEYKQAFFDDRTDFRNYFTGYRKGYGVVLHNGLKEESRIMFREFCERYGIRINEPEQASEVNTYMDKNTAILRTVLSESDGDVLLRIPVEVMETLPEKDIAGLIRAFQSRTNGYVELFYASSCTAVPGESVYNKYGIEKKKLPYRFRRKRDNTVTLLPVFKGEELTRTTVLNNLGDLELDPTDTIIIPVGFQHDKSGIIRGMVLGMKMMYMARCSERGANIDGSFLDATVEELKQLYEARGGEDFSLKGQDLIDIASGNINDLIRALRELVKILPVTPFDTEELRQIYFHAREVVLNA